jgi:hypothetical protein
LFPGKAIFAISLTCSGLFVKVFNELE